ncbi:phosphoadenylyl-sulfate reductase [Amphibiibacter pelophylacis]|uniref:Phosphoadenylyl-sulfate reductase n=1 Tax=Amphibiibacter pelophylacis TaxID=1799477 RepID=A0ACC6P1I5_9BURK
MNATSHVQPLYLRHTRPSSSFDAKVARTLDHLRLAADAHPGQIVQATSLGAEDVVLTDLIWRHGLAIDVATLQTGRLHAQTLALLEQLPAHYDALQPGATHRIAAFEPETAALAAWTTQHGDDGDSAIRASIDTRKSCCGVRKLEPLQRLLAGRSAWVVGLRAEQSTDRASAHWREEDPGRDGVLRLKYSPLLDWTWGDVWHYIDQHGVPYNPLHDDFMPSIGCAPCTRAIAIGEDFRAGRWWWEDAAQKECGLHVHDDASAAPTVSALPDRRP